MEGDLEAAAHFGEKKAWTADLAIGASPDMMNGLLAEGQFPVVSRRHYLMYRPTEATSIRAGKFLTDYGIYFSEHSIATRQGIGFDQGNETYNLEYSYQGESWSGSLTAVLGRPDDSSLLMEKGFAASGGIHLLDHHKIGWSAYYGTLNGTSRELTGPFLLLGFTPHFYFTGESDLQWMQPKNQSATQGVFSYGRLGYEVIQGVHIYLMTQNSTHAFSGTPQALAPQAKYGNLINRMTGFGPGVIWYPRPHFYVKFELQNQISSELPSGQTSGYLTGNIYL